MATYYTQISGIILGGDLNVHHKRWLRFSREDTRIGSELKIFCDFYGLNQLVREPTRNEYLLDLVISDIAGSSVKTLPSIADHKAVLMHLKLPEIAEIIIPRTLWHLKDAQWQALEKELSEIEWSNLKKGTAEDSLQYFLDILWTLLVRHIPSKKIKCKKSTHP